MSLVESLGVNSSTPLPRSNGELVFEEPWESRAFGIAAVLTDKGVFNWDEFRDNLIAAIEDYEQKHDSIAHPYRYYERWYAALEALVTETGAISKEDLDAKVADFEKRPPGHDHDHDHDHGHDH